MSLVRLVAAATALAAGASVSGCGSLRAANLSVAAPVEGPLAETLVSAEGEVALGRFGIADRILADYTQRHANTTGAAEAAFWRALFHLDPMNPTAGPPEAIALLNDYLAGSVAVRHQAAASTLRRVSEELGRSGVPMAAPTDGPAPAARPDARAESRAEEKAREDEITRLKEELAKANAELERIKRRLTQPNP